MLNNRKVTITLAIAIAGAFCAPIITQADGGNSLPITRVTLYTSGVGYFERGAAVDGDSTSTLLFPTDQINDVLKSLVLLDTGGAAVQPVTYAAQDPADKRLQAFSVDVSDNPDRATLMNRLRGTHVLVTLIGTVAAKPLDGTIAGVETQTVILPNNDGTTRESTLNVLCDDGLRAIPFANIDSIKIADPSVDAELREALSVVAQGRDSSKRGVTLHFGGTGHRNVLVGYLTEAPLWQTTYRLVLGAQPRIQGWALVQNTSQDDWQNIDLSLVSGRPISFIQDMYTPIYVPRPVVQAQVEGSPTPQTYNSNMQEDEEKEAAASPAPQMPAAMGGGGFGGGAGRTVSAFRAGGEFLGGANRDAASASALRQTIAASGGKLGTSLFSYQIKVPVTIPRQQSAMIPFISTDIKAESVSIYDPTVEQDHPLTGARVHNTTGLNLMGGPLTIFDEGPNGVGYVGDATMDDTEPNQTRLISYAVDQAVDADSQPGAGSGTIVAVTIADSMLNTTVKTVESTIYHFKNHSSLPRTVVVEQADPGADWKLVAPAAATEKTANMYRFDVAVAASESKSFTVSLEQPELQQVQLLDGDEPTMLSYCKEGEISDAVKAAIQEVLHRRHEIAGLQNQLANEQAEVESISNGQSRIRDNMKALDHGSALYKRYVTELNDQETKLNDLQSQENVTQSEITQKQTDLTDYVSHLKLE